MTAAFPIVDPSVAIAGQSAGTAGGVPEPIFTTAQVEELAMRRFNPYARLTAESLARALDSFAVGDLRWAAMLWAEIAKRDTTISTVKEKREEAVALRDWTTVALDESPAAADQAAALKTFYQGVKAGDALDRHTTGGFPLLATQMMDAVAFKYALHHLMWKPDAAAKFKLPSGRMVPTLGLTAELVPLEYFENRTGELRFLSVDQAYNGTPLAPNAWLVTVGPGLMIGASIRHYYKRLAEHDLINFSEKFGTPGLVIHTTASKDSAEGAAAVDMARSLAGNYRGVQFNASENKVEVVWPSGGTGGNNLPMTTIIENINRELTSLWLGEDLSTMSRSGTQRNIGASVQGDEREKRERADCARLSETLNAQIDPVVIRWFFGTNAPILARVVLESPINEDRSLLGNLVQLMVSLGAQVPVNEIARRLQVPLAKDKEAVLIKPIAPIDPTPDNTVATNAAPAGQGDVDPRLRNSMAIRYAKGKLRDMQPLTGKLADIETISNPVIQRAALLKFVADLPQILGQINADPEGGRVLADGMSAALFNGFAESTVGTHGTTATNVNDLHRPPGDGGGQFAPKGDLGSIDAVIDHSHQNRQTDGYHDYQRLGEQEAAEIQGRSGMDVRGYKRVLTSSAVTHVLNTHGDDPRPIKEDDFRQLATRLANPVSQEVSPREGKLDRLVSKVHDSEGHLVIVEEQRTGRSKLSLVSMYRP